ncbi:hypothetical protein HWD13_gp121 [Phage NBSal005]|uniref:Uncharacterized protein n=1 Tax=Phage NBSal005 TaxID=2991865 RepID=A0A6G8R025_9CAUD|nr:hypothetical protein HWD13_gp121 [Phage NBSal005]QIN93227.1 hypothetical protein [Phage NBSal005]
MILGKTKITSAGDDLITLSLYYKDENVEIETLEYILITTNKPKIGELFDIISRVSAREDVPSITPKNIAHLAQQLGILWYKVDLPAKERTKGTFAEVARKPKTENKETGEQASDI